MPTWRVSSLMVLRFLGGLSRMRRPSTRRGSETRDSKGGRRQLMRERQRDCRGSRRTRTLIHSCLTICISIRGKRQDRSDLLFRHSSTPTSIKARKKKNNTWKITSLSKNSVKTVTTYPHGRTQTRLSTVASMAWWTWRRTFLKLFKWKRKRLRRNGSSLRLGTCPTMSWIISWVDSKLRRYRGRKVSS